MTPDQFAPFYEAVHGYPPFPWQVRLAHQVAKQGWPAVLALPTAAGKTSAIDIAVFSLALQAGQPLQERTAPLRIFFVIDRRLVVDQAADHARDLKHRLENPGGNVPLSEMAAALRSFGGAAALHVVALRGAMYRDDSWAKRPNQPTVCVSTVDQVGSRLLFRGYGVSEYARPVHAALTGNDALYLIDEAHLSQPFLDTLQAVRRYRTAPWAEAPLGGPFGIVEISATPQSEGERFGLGEGDQENTELSRRLNVSKPACFVEPAGFEAEAAERAVEACTGNVKVVGIVVNRVASARQVFELLPGEPFEDKVLLTGRIRPWDRDVLLGRCLDRLRVGRTRSAEDRPLFVCATMTVEVGADLDFDYLITEASPLASLRQRFGRLDRLGKFGRAAGVILLRRTKDPDPIYGEELAQTWQWLQGQAEGSEAVIDFGVNALDELIRRASIPPPQAEPRRGPILFPAHLDALVQTSPAPEPSPDIAPFLHGAEALDTADVQVVWRADLHAGKEEDWLETVAAAPPRSREALAVPINAVRNWLREAPPTEVADIEGLPGEAQRGETGRPALRWRGPESEESSPIPPGEVRPGDTMVVPAAYGGADEFGWNPASSEPVADVGDLCLNEMANTAPGGGRRLVRLRLYEGFNPTEDTEAQKLVEKLQRLLKDGEDTEDALDELLNALTARPATEPLTQSVITAMVSTRPKAAAYPAGVVLTARVQPGFFGSEREPPEQEDDSTDEDDASSIRAGTWEPVTVSLDEHLEGVAHWTKTFASRLGLSEEFFALLVRAARLHDIGKADWRFQFLLYGDEPDEVLLAKSGRDINANQRAAIHKRANLPEHFRHELVSVALIRNHREQVLGDMRDGHGPLVEYLVGSHHGRGRPFVPVIEDKKPEQVTLSWQGHRLFASSDHGLARLDSRWADQFWELTRRYGYWGLAYLEAVLRLADGARSAEEQHHE
jgi:CRISPR-associated endonuclease/helicase Cas3